jgi:folate-binding protein YgfZ
MQGSVALYRDADRVIWQATGDRAIEALNGLLTNDLRTPGSCRVIPCLALTPKGRPLADVRVWKRGPDAGPVLLDLPESGAVQLLEHFGRYLPPRFARIEPLSESALFHLVGPGAPSVISRLIGDGSPPPGPGGLHETRLESQELVVAGRAEREGGGWNLLAPVCTRSLEAAIAAAVAAVGGSVIGERDWETFRIEHGIPLYGQDFDLRNLPQETGLTGETVSFDKGCYTGQEVVARIHYRGHVNRRLAGLSRADAEPIPIGIELYAGDRAVGSVTSSAVSPRFGPIALGMIRSEIEAGARLATSAGGDPAIELAELPFTST